MNKLFVSFILVLFLFIGFCSCHNPTFQKKDSAAKKIDVLQLFKMKSTDTTNLSAAPFYYTVHPIFLNCRVPALQSFVYANYNGLWILLAGKKKVFTALMMTRRLFPQELPTIRYGWLILTSKKVGVRRCFLISAPLYQPPIRLIARLQPALYVWRIHKK